MPNCLPNTIPARSALPTFEPVTLREAKWQCRIDESDAGHDVDLTRLIQSARETVEHDTGVVLATGTFTWSLANWPASAGFTIPLRPVSSITSIAYVDAGGASQTLSTDVYGFDGNRVQPTIFLKYGQTWPAARGDENSITITLVAGYASEASIPAIFKQLVLLDVARNFEDPSGTLVMSTRTGRRLEETGTGAYDLLLRRVLRSSYP